MSWVIVSLFLGFVGFLVIEANKIDVVQLDVPTIGSVVPPPAQQIGISPLAPIIPIFSNSGAV